jgi:hypothetical protein
MLGSFFPSLWSSKQPKFTRVEEPTLLCNQVDLRRGNLSGNPTTQELACAEIVVTSSVMTKRVSIYLMILVIVTVAFLTGCSRSSPPAASGVPDVQVFAPTWKVGEERQCESNPNERYFLKCELTTPQVGCDLSPCWKGDEAVVRMPAKVFSVIFPEKDPWAPESLRAAKEKKQRSLEQLLAIAPAGPTRDYVLTRLNEINSLQTWSCVKKDSATLSCAEWKDPAENEARRAAREAARPRERAR